MNPHVLLSVGWMVCRSAVCRNFVGGPEYTLPCSCHVRALVFVDTKAHLPKQCAFYSSMVCMSAIDLQINLSFISLSIYQLIWQSNPLPIYLSMYLSTYLPIQLSLPGHDVVVVHEVSHLLGQDLGLPGLKPTQNTLHIIYICIYVYIVYTGAYRETQKGGARFKGGPNIEKNIIFL